MSDDKPKLIMKGSLGFRKDTLDAEQLAYLRRQLTLESPGFKDQPSTIVYGFHEDQDYFWVPRYFNHLDWWPKIKNWEWVTPAINYKLESNFTLDPKRKQPEAVASLERHLRHHSAGISIQPTGLGKTLTALEVARRFDTPIGILIYAGHQIDNWVDHIVRHLGVPKKDIGIIKEGKCSIGKPVTIISIQTVLSRDLPQAALDQFGFIISDEVHRFGSEMWGKVVGRFPARYRLGISADPIRDDGLDPIIRWNFGKVGYALHTRPTGELPLVCLIRYPTATYETKINGKTVITQSTEYPKKKYSDWKKIRGKWVRDGVNFQKYCKLLAKDSPRNDWIVDKIFEARCKGRVILVFTHYRDHLKDLHDRFVKKWNLAQAELGIPNSNTKTALLWGGLKEKERQDAQTADVIFTTHGFAREALNITTLDTLIFGTPPGNPLQPAGRLRDKGPTTRKSLLIIDPFENGQYPFRKAMKRKVAYEDLGMTVKRMAVTKK